MLNFTHIGIGQCGNRFADEFAAKGRVAIAINTANIDMRGLTNIVAKNKIHIALEGAKDGAGRNPEVGRSSMEANIDMVYTRIMESSENTDIYVIWAGLGGGTGTGGVGPLMEKMCAEGHKVILALTLPSRDEGRKVRTNALTVLDALTATLDEDSHPVVPYLVIDNDRIKGDVSSYNEVIAYNLMKFTNTTRNQPADSAFDDTDFANTLYYRGAMALVRTTIAEKDLNVQSFSKTIQDEWNKSPYAKFNASEAAGAATLIIASEKFLSGKGNIELIKDNVRELEKIYPHADPYSCIYGMKDGRDKVTVFSLLTCLGAPEESLDQIYDDVQNEVQEDMELRQARSEKAAKSRQRRKISVYDPNKISAPPTGTPIRKDSFAIHKN